MRKNKTILKEQDLSEIRSKMKMLYEYTYFNKEQLTEDEEEQPEGGEEPQEDEEIDDSIDTSDEENDTEQVEDDGLIDANSEEEEFDSTEDEVVNIDDLTDSQKNTESMVGDVSEKLNSLIQIVQNFNDTVDKLQKQNDDLFRELEKRVPTKTEKLNLRVLQSYPYDVNLKGYWSDVERNSNYRALPDEDDEDEVEYVITMDDVRM